MAEPSSSPTDHVRQLYGEAEERTAAVLEELVGGRAFGTLFGRFSENLVAVNRIGFDMLDTVVRNLRLAGRQDIARLGRQLARTEDKLERVLQEVEQLRDEARTRAEQEQPAGNGRAPAPAGKAPNGK